MLLLLQSLVPDRFKAFLDRLQKDVGASEQSNDRHPKFFAWLIMKLTEQFESFGDCEAMMTSVWLKWPEPWRLRQLEIVHIAWKMPNTKTRPNT